MHYVYKPHGKRKTNHEPHPVAQLMSAHRYKTMMRALLAQSRAQRASKATDEMQQSSAATSVS